MTIMRHDITITMTIPEAALSALAAILLIAAACQAARADRAEADLSDALSVLSDVATLDDAADRYLTSIRERGARQ